MSDKALTSKEIKELGRKAAADKKTTNKVAAWALVEIAAQLADLRELLAERLPGKR
jgi:hypothetical protein